jgi:hypothetical protein
VSIDLALLGAVCHSAGDLRADHPRGVRHAVGAARRRSRPSFRSPEATWNPPAVTGRRRVAARPDAPARWCTSMSSRQILRDASNADSSRGASSQMPTTALRRQSPWLNETAARRLWPSGDALGQTIQVGRRPTLPRSSASRGIANYVMPGEAPKADDLPAVRRRRSIAH